MPIFRFTGFSPDGTEKRGTIEADGLKDAVVKLKQDGILPKDLKSQSVAQKRRLFVRDRTDKLVQITRQLSILISSGVSVNDSLKSLSDENSGYWRSILVDLRESLSSGAGLARSMEAHKEIFPEFYISMIHAGETGGMLDSVLVRLSDFLEKEMSIRSKVSHAMTYPLFMFSIGVIVLSFIFSFVVPKIVVIFENAEASLPFATVVLLSISNLFHSYWWILLALIMGLFFAIKRSREKKPEILDSLLLKFPLTRSLYISRFTRIFGFLLSGGISLLKALDLAARSTGNTVLKDILSGAAAKITEGSSVAASLDQLPPVLRQMIATGEKSGELPKLLDRAADAYEEEFSKRVQTMLSLLEPSMIVIMGLVVGFIVFAVLLPIFEMNQLVR